MTAASKPPTPTLTHPERAARRAAIADAMLGGGDENQVARRFGVSPATVVACCREFGVAREAKLRGPKASARSMEIVAALLLGGRKSDVARRFGVSRQRVQQVNDQARSAGIPLPGGRTAAAMDDARIEESA
jgi:transposase